ncbi:CarD family transcriptional regulator [Aureimonas sp. Leaf460]|nr:Crp/Fnr family transcriptional regulator [Aureimonas sp. Leaf460]KQT64017.1 CarD family transcriptional regulator [Aureimonas sp. Leaf427]KQT81210.1 CarD family transcriptional regulator [Aureimonas sp. Leaf460]
MSLPMQKACRNRILQAVSPQSFAKLQPHLEHVELPLKTVLVEPREATSHLIFLESGLGSNIAFSGGEENEQIEVGHIGREGMSAIHLVLDVDRTSNGTFMQVAGSGYRILATHLLQAMEEDRALDRLMRRYVYTYQIQLAQSALANGRFNMNERLARWLLMCHDRLDSADLPLTHDFLSLMLGVRRAGVTNEIHVLEGLGAIKATRARVQIRDRVRLEEIAGACYGIPERAYDRLIGGSWAAPATAN